MLHVDPCCILIHVAFWSGLVWSGLVWSGLVWGYDDISSQKIFDLYGLKHHIVENRGGVTDAGRTNEQTLKIELLSQWKLEAEFRNSRQQQKTSLSPSPGPLPPEKKRVFHAFSFVLCSVEQVSHLLEADDPNPVCNHSAARSAEHLCHELL